MTSAGPRSVSFESGGRKLAGHLFGADGPAPGVIVTGSWTTVKEQMADLYARKLAEAGFTTLTFDFAHFGESEGEPRQFESPERKIDDISAAARWLSERDDVLGAAVGGLAICASAGYMAHAIARGAPIGAFATVAAWLHDPDTVGEMYGGDDGIAERIRDGEAARQAYEADGEVRYVPAFSENDPKAAMGEMVKPYYGDPAKGVVPEWTNRFAVMSWPGWLKFNGVEAASGVSVPTLMVHSEEAAFPDNVRRFASELRGPQRVLWREGTQLDFYHAPPQVDPAVEAVADHFRQRLGNRQ